MLIDTRATVHSPSALIGTLPHNPLRGRDGPLPTMGLNLDELMLWLSTKMNSTDSAIRSKMTEMDSGQKQNVMLNKLVTDIHLMAKSVDSAGGTDVTGEWITWAKDNNYELEPWYQNLEPGAKTAVQAFFEDVNGAGDIRVSREAITNLELAIKDEMGANASAHELALIQLQSAVSARGQAIQMVSNIVNTMNESAKQTIGNIR